MKFSLLINMKMPTTVGIFIFISREISFSAMFGKKEFAVVSNLIAGHISWSAQFYNLGTWPYSSVDGFTRLVPLFSFSLTFGL